MSHCNRPVPGNVVLKSAKLWENSSDLCENTYLKSAEMMDSAYALVVGIGSFGGSDPVMFFTHNLYLTICMSIVISYV